MTLEIKNLNVAYGNHHVLHDVSIKAAQPGQFVGVLGPNASGKSTLFKTITGLNKAKSGTMLLDGVELSSLGRKDRARQISYMPQTYGSNAYLSVFDAVLLALKQISKWHVNENELDNVHSILSELSLAEIANRPLATLSGGQKQMVAVAQTLVRTPRLVLLDEPTSALDLHHQLSIMSAIRKAMIKRNLIVFAALHDLNLAAQFCDQLILIREGRIVANGNAPDVLAMEEIGQTYQVEASLEMTRRGTCYVDAKLPT